MPIINFYNNYENVICHIFFISGLIAILVVALAAFSAILMVTTINFTLYYCPLPEVKVLFFFLPKSLFFGSEIQVVKILPYPLETRTLSSSGKDIFSGELKVCLYT